MGRKKGTGAEDKLYVSDGGATPDLVSQPALPVAVKIPKLIEYQISSERWRCSKFDELVAEFQSGLVSETMVRFHEACALKERGWQIVRRLYGITPVLPPPDFDADDLRVWNRTDLQTLMGLERKHLNEELDAMRGHWMRFSEPTAAVAAVEGKKEFKEGLALGEDEVILARHNFRVTFEDQQERAWFMQRIAEFEKAKLLEDKMGRGLATNALLAELQMQRLDRFLNNPRRCETGGGTWASRIETKQKLEKAYNDTIEQLQKQCPWAGLVAGNYSFAGALSDVSRAIQEYYANGDHHLVDGIFTATEIQVECRMSLQAQNPRYRLGLVVFLNSARAGLFDRAWQPQFSNGQLRKLDKAFKDSYRAQSLEDETLIPDLTKDGQEGEYPALELPSVLAHGHRESASAQPLGEEPLTTNEHE